MWLFIATFMISSNLTYKVKIKEKLNLDLNRKILDIFFLNIISQLISNEVGRG